MLWMDLYWANNYILSKHKNWGNGGFYVADSRNRGRGDVSLPSSASNVSKLPLDPGSSAVANQSSRSGVAAKQSAGDASARMRNGPVGAGAGKTPPSSKVQNGQ